MNAARTLLSDADWAALSGLLPGRAGTRGVTARDTRRFVEAVLWVGRTGLPWREAGYPLGFVLTEGQAGDAPQAAALLAPHLAPGRLVLADTAYDSNAVRAQIAAAGAVAVIPPKPNRRQPPVLDRTLYRDRNQAERLIIS